MGSREVKFEHRCRECLKPSAVVRKDPKAVCTRCQGKAGRNKKRLDQVNAGKAGFEAVDAPQSDNIKATTMAFSIECIERKA